MAERETMLLHQTRLNHEAAAYKAEIEHAMQKQRLMDEAAERVAQAERKAEQLEKEREVARLRRLQWGIVAKVVLFVE